MLNWIKQNKDKLVRIFIITSFLSLYILISCISMIHSVSFFKLSNANWLAISLALGFELGAAASLSSIIVLDKMNKFIVWGLFIILTIMQMMGNAYYAYSHLFEYQQWIELFGLIDLTEIEQKRILAIVSGAILPVVALGFIKSLVDYIRPQEEVIEEHIISENTQEPIIKEIIKEVYRDSVDIESVKQLLHEQDEVISNFINTNTNKRLFNNVIKKFSDLKNINNSLKLVYNIPSIPLKENIINSEEAINSIESSEIIEVPIIEEVEKEIIIDNKIEELSIVEEVKQDEPIIEIEKEIIIEPEKVVPLEEILKPEIIEEIKQIEIKEEPIKETKLDENKNHIYGEKAVKLNKELKDYFDEKQTVKKRDKGMQSDGGIKV